MPILETILSAASYALAGAAVEPFTGPISDIAGKVAGAATRGASRIAATHAAMRGITPYPTQLPATQLQTGKSFWETAKDEIARWGSPDRWQEGVFDPVKAETQRWGEWVAANPCESMKMAAFLAFGLGTPQQALSPCPPQQQQQQLGRAKFIRYAVIGAVGVGIVWAFTRKRS